MEKPHGIQQKPADTTRIRNARLQTEKVCTNSKRKKKVMPLHGCTQSERALRYAIEKTQNALEALSVIEGPPNDWGGRLTWTKGLLRISLYHLKELLTFK